MLKGKGSSKQAQPEPHRPSAERGSPAEDPVAGAGNPEGVPCAASGMPGGSPSTETPGASTLREPTEETAEVEDPGVEQAEAARVTSELEALRDKYLRLMADFENFKKRAAREKADLIQYGNEALLKDLLPVIDDIERVVAYSAQEGNWTDFQKGVELIVSEIHKTLSGHGVKPLEAVGEPFDPNLHEAMQRVETDQTPPDTVVQEFQKGYLLRDRLLRPSLVAVAVPGCGTARRGGGVEGAEDSGPPAGDDGAGDREAKEEAQDG